MGVVNIDLLASTTAILIGAMLIASALYAQRGGRLRYRQGAKVLLGVGVMIGVAVLLTGAFLLVRALSVDVL
jgi:hypothetical protein